jgi:hypothetical protein
MLPGRWLSFAVFLFNSLEGCGHVGEGCGGGQRKPRSGALLEWTPPFIGDRQLPKLEAGRSCPLATRRRHLMKITTIGLDLAKNVFQAHGAH